MTATTEGGAMSEGTESEPREEGQDEGVPSHAAGTPPIGDEGQNKGETTHPAPEDEVGPPPSEEGKHRTE